MRPGSCQVHQVCSAQLAALCILTFHSHNVCCLSLWAALLCGDSGFGG